MKNKDYGVVANWNYVTFSLILLVILTLLVIYVPVLRDFDNEILSSIRKALSPYPATIPSLISCFGYANYLLWPQIAGCSVLVSHQKYLKAFLLVFFTQAAFFLNGLLKNFICRQRPCEYYGYSFPSNHATVEMCFYGICIYLILRYTKSNFWRYFLSSVFGIFIFMVCLSRLWLGVHFLTDVIAGLCLGFALVNLYIITVKAFEG
jgi:undecaprenyl-diphosphatase